MTASCQPVDASGCQWMPLDALEPKSADDESVFYRRCPLEIDGRPKWISEVKDPVLADQDLCDKVLLFFLLFSCCFASWRGGGVDWRDAVPEFLGLAGNPVLAWCHYFFGWLRMLGCWKA
jgi:hypothetical protein